MVQVLRVYVRVEGLGFIMDFKEFITEFRLSVHIVV